MSACVGQCTEQRLNVCVCVGVVEGEVLEGGGGGVQCFSLDPHPGRGLTWCDGKLKC